MSFLNSVGRSVKSQLTSLFRNSNFCGYLNSLGRSVKSQLSAAFKTHILFRHIIHIVVALNRNSPRDYMSNIFRVLFNSHRCSV
jgi:hypothetical protein